MSDLYDVKLNKKVAVWYLTRRIPQMLRAKGKPVTVENILIAYNAGIGRVVKGIKPSETRQYLKKYQKLAKGE
jgi:soluble lytic murein transglycosylase-like protein